MCKARAPFWPACRTPSAFCCTETVLLHCPPAQMLSFWSSHSAGVEQEDQSLPHSIQLCFEYHQCSALCPEPPLSRGTKASAALCAAHADAPFLSPFPRLFSFPFPAVHLCCHLAFPTLSTVFYPSSLANTASLLFFPVQMHLFWTLPSAAAHTHTCTHAHMHMR